MTPRSNRHLWWPLLLATVFSVVLIPAVAMAHPLGNFTINQHIGIHVAEDDLGVEYVIDMAEIPAFAVLREIDPADPAALHRHALAECSSAAPGLGISLDSKVVDLRLLVADVSTPPGNSGVPTLRIECSYAAEIRPGRLTVANINYADRIGWREIIATSEGVAISTDLPSVSASARLTAYPEDRLSSVPDMRTAEIVIGSGRVTVGTPPGPPQVAALGSWLRLDALGLKTGLIAIAAAVALGAGHALAPGHGKTVVAAYLVGSRGTWRQAVILALATAVSHTVGVALLGLLAATASTTFEPTVVYPYLSAVAGLVVVVIGTRLMWRLLHAHGHHEHEHDSHQHHHAHPHQSSVLSWKSVAALGLSGGLVPSASAVVLLLGAIHIGHAWFGVVLVAAFGVGMSLALVSSGMLVVIAQRWGWRVLSRRRRVPATRWVAQVGAGAVILLGVAMTVSALEGIGPGG